MRGSIGPAGAQLLQMGAQVDEQVAPFFLATASVGRAMLRDQLRQLAVDALVDATPCLENRVPRYSERCGDGRISFVEERALENSALRAGEENARRLRREQLGQPADCRRLDPFPPQRKEIRKIVVRHARERGRRCRPVVMHESESASLHVTGGLPAIMLGHDRPDAVAAVEEVERRGGGIENLGAARVGQVMVAQAEMQREHVDAGRQLRRLKLLAREQDLVAREEALVEPRG
jgi:hypothetical protein